MKVYEHIGMKLIACEACGTVVDLVILRKNEDENKGFNSSYHTTSLGNCNIEWWQCRSCQHRTEIKDDKIFDTSKE